MVVSHAQHAQHVPVIRHAEPMTRSQKPGARIAFPLQRRIRTVFVMNDELLRHGLVHVVSKAGDLAIVGELKAGGGLTERLRQFDFDLVVVDDDGTQSILDMIARLEPSQKAVVVTDDSPATSRHVDLIQAGADALVHRRSSSGELLTAVHKVLDGCAALDTHSLAALIAELRNSIGRQRSDNAENLTRREQEVLELLTDGLDNRTIAKRLFIAEATVKFHLHNIMDKFGVHKRTALVAAALRSGNGLGSSEYARSSRG